MRLLRGTSDSNHTRLSNNRSVMPLDVRGRTRATMSRSTSVYFYPSPKGRGNPLNPTRARDREL